MFFKSMLFNCKLHFPMLYLSQLSMKKENSNKSKYIQQELGLNQSKSSVVFAKIKNFFSVKMYPIKTASFFLNPFIWLLIISTAVFIIFQNKLIDENYANLPGNVPLFNFYITLKNRLVPKESLRYIPIVSSSISLISILFSSIYYRKFKNTVFILMLFTALAIFIVFISLIKLFSYY